MTTDDYHPAHERVTRPDDGVPLTGVTARAMRDTRLSFAARGLLLVLLDTDADLSAAGQPMDAVRAARPGAHPAEVIPLLEELALAGYLAEVERVNDAKHGRGSR